MTRGLLYGAAALLCLGACRGSVSEDPPIHIIPDMDWQPRYQSQGHSAFFDDGRAMRPPVEGTVAASRPSADSGRIVPAPLKEDDPGFYFGKVDGAYLAKVPFEVDTAVVRRGQQRYNIFCTPCHDQTGAGRGLVVQRGFHLPVDLASEHTRTISDGEIYEIISKGVRNMPAYGAQIPEKDRWAIVSWVRVLQRSQHGSLADVPPEQQGKIEEAAQ